MRTLFLFSLVSLFFSAAAQTPSVEWGRGGICSNEDFGTSVAADNSGNSYVTGYFKDTLTLGATILISAGEKDIFFAKYNNSGSLEWAGRMGGAGDDVPSDIMVDANGIYIAGFVTGDVTIGSTVLTSFGQRDALLVKCDDDGNVAWAKNYGSISNDNSGELDRLSSGDVILTGSFSDSIGIFGTQIVSNLGDADVFVLSVAPDGSTVWVRRFGSVSSEHGRSIAVDAADNIYLGGIFSYTMSFGSIPALNYNSDGFVVGNTFITKLSPNGSPVWARQIGGVNSCTSSIAGVVSLTEIDVTSTGMTTVMGYFNDCKLKLHNGTLLGNGIESFTFLIEYQDNSDIAWTKLCAASFSGQQAICIDDNDDLFVTDRVHTSTFIGADTIYGAGNTSDVYVAKLTANGVLQWGYALVSPGNESPRGITSSADGSLFVVGTYVGAPTVFANDTLQDNGSFDFFLTKLSQNLKVQKIHSIAPRINVYPNPSAGNFTIDIPGGDFSRLTLYNSSGQKVHEASLALAQKRVSVNAGLLPAGIYFAKLHGAVDIYEKIVIEK